MTVNITYHADTRLMEITSVSTGIRGKAVATTGDDLSTRLQFTFDDEEETLDGYNIRTEFGVNILETESPTTYLPYIPLDENNGVVLPYYILSNVKCSELPVQLAFTKIENNEKTEFYSLNILDLAINKALDATSIPHKKEPWMDDAIYDVQYDDATATFTFTQLDGTQFSISLTDLSEEHFEVATREDLVTLSQAERGDTATALDTGVWYKLYGSYDDLTKWYPMSGNATINGEQTGTPVFYAPHVSGTQYQMLVSDGQTEDDGHGHITEHPPVWTTISRKYVLNFTNNLHDIDVPNIMGTNDLFCKFTDSNGNDIMLEYYTQTKNDIDYITISTNLSETINMQVFAIPYVRAVSE